jgi:hypothetical protein
MSIDCSTVARPLPAILSKLRIMIRTVSVRELYADVSEEPYACFQGKKVISINKGVSDVSEISAAIYQTVYSIAS